VKDFDLVGNSLPMCPHCGDVDQDWWDGLPLKNDGDSWESCCGNCDKEYKVTININTTFDTKEMPANTNERQAIS